MGLRTYGLWVNGGVWTTCEARMLIGYYRVNATDDALESMRAITHFAEQWQMDAPLKNFGTTPWFDSNPINLAFDAWGVPAGFIRGVFEYLYEAEELMIVPH